MDRLPEGRQEMAQTVRTKKTHRDIKALDKTMTAAERMKNTYVWAKDRHGAGRNRAAPWNM